MFKIRATAGPDVGQYSRGGNTPSFNKVGKVWNARGHVSNHLQQLSHVGRIRYRAGEVVIIEFQEGVEGFTEHPYEKWLQGIIDRENQRQAAQNARREELNRQSRYQQYLKLKAEFEPDGW